MYRFRWCSASWSQRKHPHNELVASSSGLSPLTWPGRDGGLRRSYWLRWRGMLWLLLLLLLWWRLRLRRLLLLLLLGGLLVGGDVGEGDGGDHGDGVGERGAARRHRTHFPHVSCQDKRKRIRLPTQGTDLFLPHTSSTTPWQPDPSTRRPLWARIEKKQRLNSHLINHCPTSEGVSEVSERANE